METPAATAAYRSLFESVQPTEGLDSCPPIPDAPTPPYNTPTATTATTTATTNVPFKMCQQNSTHWQQHTLIQSALAVPFYQSPYKNYLITYCTAHPTLTLLGIHTLRRVAKAFKCCSPQRQFDAHKTNRHSVTHYSKNLSVTLS